MFHVLDQRNIYFLRALGIYLNFQISINLKYHLTDITTAIFTIESNRKKQLFREITSRAQPLIISSAPLPRLEKLPTISPIEVLYILEVISPVLFSKSAISIE